MNMQEIYKLLIEDYLNINSEQIIVLSGILDTSENCDLSDVKIIEDLALLVRNRGAFPVLDLASKSLKIRVLEETPEENYFVPTEYFSQWVKLVNVIIDLSFPEIRNIFTDNYFTAQKTDLINKSLQAIYKNMLIADKIVLLPNFPKKAIANYYNIDLSILERFYIGTFGPIENKMNVKGLKVLNHIVPGKTFYLQDNDDTQEKLKLQISDQQSYFVSNTISSSYTVLPYGFVSLTVDKNSLTGVIKAEKLYYKNLCKNSVTIHFSYGNILSLQFENNDSIAEIIKVGLINSKERVEFFIGVNNGVSEHCNYNYYDRCIDNNFSLVFYDELNNIIEISSKSVQLTNENSKNILL